MLGIVLIGHSFAYVLFSAGILTCAFTFHSCCLFPDGLVCMSQRNYADLLETVLTVLMMVP